MFAMQVDIAVRGASLLIPGGELMYSTCSIDPVENEAVVAEVLRRCPYLELVPIHLDGLVLHDGRTEWPVLDESGEPANSEELLNQPFIQPSHLDPNLRVALGEGEADVEMRIADQLKRCKRLWHDDNNTGGFFVARFRHVAEAHADGIAHAYRSRRSMRRDEGWSPTVKTPPSPTPNSVVLADEGVVNHVETMYGVDLSSYSCWQRGKRLNVAPPMVNERLFQPPSPTNKGDVWGGNSFHPVRVLHAGLPAFTLKKASWRSRQKPSTHLANGSRATWRPSRPISSFVCFVGGHLWSKTSSKRQRWRTLSRVHFCSEANCLGARRRFRCGLGLSDAHDRHERTKHSPTQTEPPLAG